MSLSTLLEAAQYLDYLDSSNQQPQWHQQQQQHHHNNHTNHHDQYHHLHNHNLDNNLDNHNHQDHQIQTAQKSIRCNNNKKTNDLMPPMSLPANFGVAHIQGVPIPLISAHNYHNHQVASSLSSSLTTGSPLSSASGFSSATLLCSLASGTTSGSVGSSLSSSTSSSSASSSYSRHRELHKTLEKNRRTHLRHCFELLKSQLPSSEYADKKTSHINIIKSAIKCVYALKQEENDLKNEVQRLAKIKNQLTERIPSHAMTIRDLPSPQTSSKSSSPPLSSPVLVPSSSQLSSGGSAVAASISDADLQTSAETKMLLNSLANKLSLK